MSKNKKKTAREKRILVGAFLTAVVIAAGSTFAWFTSSDTVTNRLSANADYNVSVIETFTPPANWIPGQKVNKDTSAINTGNIEAFVKQKLEGVMQVTLEYADDSEFSLTGGNTYVELTEDEVDVIEAGGFLAYAKGDEVIGIEKGSAVATPTQCYLGEISAVHSGADVEPGDFGSTAQFTPPATGNYIFRREIKISPKEDETDMSKVTEEYEYVGYHYDATTGKYYKIKHLSALQPKEDGILVAAPTVYYAVEKEEKKTLPLRFEAAKTAYFLTYTGTDSQEKKVEVTGAGEDGTKGTITYKKYTKVEGGDLYVIVSDSNTTNPLPANDVYDGIDTPITRLGTVSGSGYESNEPTPARLVATYTVDKSEDVLIDGSNQTDLSNPTADLYDAELTAIAKSDYFKAKVNYDNDYNQYILNKNAYDAGVALLTAIANNEAILKSQLDALGAVTAPTAQLAQLETTATGLPASVSITVLNAEVGEITDGDIANVVEFKNSATTYKGNPINTNWTALETLYGIVNSDFDDINSEVNTLEAAIVEAWNNAALADNLLAVTKMEDIGSYNLPANASTEAKALKQLATDLIAWEGTLNTYQNAVAQYYANLAAIHNDNSYDLQDVSGLKAAYDKAAGATIAKRVVKDKDDNVIADAALANTRAESDADSETEYLSVGADYKIDPEVTLYSGNENKPLTNSIASNGYAETKITSITGDTQFKINSKNVEDLTSGEGAPTQTADLGTAYTNATNDYNKYQTTQTNLDENDDIVIYINLDNVGDGTENDKWKLTPTLQPGAKEANFYYTSILGPGETTAILVDSVQLSENVKNAYKNFDFDLNVTVDSAQVVVSEDGNYYLPTAVSANNNFKAKPTKSEYKKDEYTGINAVDDLDAATNIVDWT